ncbi:hypothetical protein ASD24_29705 [Paenibacillus sp. Root52]|uniref:hypothetical protein n=1 Tax=Paenibacillus sp. Root52 TaxID=1736552 RepID=UPI0006F44EEA|nr:hypothetical protein [Paenibacillus sp. Root52]KQY83549.1 hypothetical protein ASD24_29705 [Paenibacillus sp. Root52]
MNMNINNYNESSPLPVDAVTGKVIPFGAKIVLFNDDSISLADCITTQCSENDPLTISTNWWSTRLEVKRNTFAAAEQYLTSEYEQSDSSYLFNALEYECETLCG